MTLNPEGDQLPIREHIDEINSQVYGISVFEVSLPAICDLDHLPQTFSTFLKYTGIEPLDSLMLLTGNPKKSDSAIQAGLNVSSPSEDIELFNVHDYVTLQSELDAVNNEADWTKKHLSLAELQAFSKLDQRDIPQNGGLWANDTTCYLSRAGDLDRNYFDSAVEPTTRLADLATWQKNHLLMLENVSVVRSSHFYLVLTFLFSFTWTQAMHQKAVHQLSRGENQSLPVGFDLSDPSSGEIYSATTNFWLSSKQNFHSSCHPPTNDPNIRQLCRGDAPILMKAIRQLTT